MPTHTRERPKKDAAVPCRGEGTVDSPIELLLDLTCEESSKIDSSCTSVQRGAGASNETSRGVSSPGFERGLTHEKTEDGDTAPVAAPPTSSPPKDTTNPATRTSKDTTGSDSGATGRAAAASSSRSVLTSSEPAASSSEPGCSSAAASCSAVARRSESDEVEIITPLAPIRKEGTSSASRKSFCRNLPEDLENASGELIVVDDPEEKRVDSMSSERSEHSDHGMPKGRAPVIQLLEEGGRPPDGTEQSSRKEPEKVESAAPSRRKGEGKGKKSSTPTPTQVQAELINLIDDDDVLEPYEASNKKSAPQSGRHSESSPDRFEVTVIESDRGAVKDGAEITRSPRAAREVRKKGSEKKTRGTTTKAQRGDLKGRDSEKAREQEEALAMRMVMAKANAARREARDARADVGSAEGASSSKDTVAPANPPPNDAKATGRIRGSRGMDGSELEGVSPEMRRTRGSSEVDGTRVARQTRQPINVVSRKKEVTSPSRSAVALPSSTFTSSPTQHGKKDPPSNLGDNQASTATSAPPVLPPSKPARHSSVSSGTASPPGAACRKWKRKQGQQTILPSAAPTRKDFASSSSSSRVRDPPHSQRRGASEDDSAAAKEGRLKSVSCEGKTGRRDDDDRLAQGASPSQQVDVERSTEAMRRIRNEEEHPERELPSREKVRSENVPISAPTETVYKTNDSGKLSARRALAHNAPTASHGPKRRKPYHSPNRCGHCETCQVEDCGECKFCLDKPKFGGKYLLHQRCEFKGKCLKYYSQTSSAGIEEKGGVDSDQGHDAQNGVVAVQPEVVTLDGSGDADVDHTSSSSIDQDAAAVTAAEGCSAQGSCCDSSLVSASTPSGSPVREDQSSESSVDLSNGAVGESDESIGSGLPGIVTDSSSSERTSESSDLRQNERGVMPSSPPMQEAVLPSSFRWIKPDMDVFVKVKETAWSAKVFSVPRPERRIGTSESWFVVDIKWTEGKKVKETVDCSRCEKLTSSGRSCRSRKATNRLEVDEKGEFIDRKRHTKMWKEKEEQPECMSATAASDHQIGLHSSRQSDNRSLGCQKSSTGSSDPRKSLTPCGRNASSSERECDSRNDHLGRKRKKENELDNNFDDMQSKQGCQAKEMKESCKEGNTWRSRSGNVVSIAWDYEEVIECGCRIPCGTNGCIRQLVTGPRKRRKLNSSTSSDVARLPQGSGNICALGNNTDQRASSSQEQRLTAVIPSPGGLKSNSDSELEHTTVSAEGETGTGSQRTIPNERCANGKKKRNTNANRSRSKKRHGRGQAPRLQHHESQARRDIVEGEATTRLESSPTRSNCTQKSSNSLLVEEVLASIGHLINDAVNRVKPLVKLGSQEQTTDDDNESIDASFFVDEILRRKITRHVERLGDEVSRLEEENTLLRQQAEPETSPNATCQDSSKSTADSNEGDVACVLKAEEEEKEIEVVGITKDTRPTNHPYRRYNAKCLEKRRDMIESVSAEKGSTQCDPDGCGLVARKNIKSNHYFWDEGAVYCEGQPLPHLDPSRDYIKLKHDKNGYFRIRASMTQWINEARGKQVPNMLWRVKYDTRQDAGGPITIPALVWYTTAEIKKGEELLAQYIN